MPTNEQVWRDVKAQAVAREGIIKELVGFLRR
jgi:hypothetical protein